MSTTNNIPVFVINMEQDNVKKTHMIKVCHDKNITPTFVNGVVGRKLHSRHKNEIHTFNEVNQRLSKSEIGCALSHISIYKKIINEKIPVSLIFEDDVDISVDIERLLELLVTCTEKWHTIHLGHHSMSSRDRPTKGSKWNVSKLSHQYKLLLPCEVSGGAYGYLISYDGAEKLLSELTNLDKAIDFYTGSNKHCNLLLLYPSVVKINNYLTDNFTGMLDRSSRSYTESTSPLIRLIKKITLSMGVYQTIDAFAINVKLAIKSFKPMKKYCST